MAERPLYTLYKNLKAQNYDVPDDYNKFESALTRDGKGSADNRHAIYENLKAQNFDVPSTYERFYSALFEPRSRTSSRAKGGSVPMSAADRARFSAGAAAISASALQTMNNAGRYNRLKQRKQKQQKDFGLVNLGTHQTPYGGDANNVVKDDFAYNPETGKTGAYVTSDNENVYSLPEAEQMQAILDKQNDAYQVAVDTGEIPSAFDVRDKNGNYDLQENIGKNGTYLTEEGAQKQFDKKLADAYARKKEIEAAIAEDHRLHGNPLLSYGASIGASNGRTAEQSDYSNKLATSLALVKQQIGALEAVKQYPTSSWGEDALKALDNTAFTAKTWDFGLTDFATMGQMERIKTKMDNNIPLSGSDKMLLKSKLGADAAAALEDEKMGNVYRWTKIAGQSLPFMADFFLTGGYGGITKGISRGALKIAAKRGMGKVGAAILKNTGIVAGDVIGSYAMAGTEQALKTGADIMQRHLGNLYQDENGDYKFGTFDENGNLLHEGGVSIGTALYKGMTSAMVENYTEKLFGHNYGIKKGAVNFMEKHGMNASAEFFKNIGKSGWYTNSKKWMEKFGINGFAEEVMEEEIGIPLHALLDGEGKVSDLLDAKQQLDIIGGMAISVGSMYAMGAGSRPVKGIYNRAQYYRFRNKVNVADSDAQNLMGDNWADIKDKIDNATNEQMGSVLADILRQRDIMTKEQINAAVNYGVNLMKMRGYNIAKTAEMNAKEITNEPTTPEEQHQADIDNAYSDGHDADDADKHDIQIQQEDQMKTLAAALGISEQQLSAMSDEELESLTGQDDKLDQAIYDYQLSSARYQGVVDDAQDKVDLAAHQAEQRVDMYTDQSRGSVRNATIKASGGLEDYGVYIISGNVATHDDGSIDVSNSDDMILYYDPTTNSVEHADALMFAELGEELPADDVKAQAVSDAKENAIKEVAGIIDGTVEVGSQFNVTDTDGTEHTYEVLADYGDGTAAISIDGNVVENPYSLADLQQMKDLEDQKRLEAAKAEREQMEKERAAQQNQETEETQPSFDFNQILNDNGNVVLVDVLDKDGNTKYPDSKLFLIRDAGAKAKVVELKNDGTIVPHAVNKEDVATISSMSLDEYKQAMPESSMIEDNSGENRGEIEVETPTIDGETAAPAEETPATEQTPVAPAITLEDGTIVPMLEDGNPDFSKLTAEQTAELYDSQFGEDADSIVSGYVSDAKKALDKASNMTVKGKTFVEQKAAKDAKEKAIADAQAAYDSAIAIRDAYNERQLAKVEDTAEGRKELIEKARRKFARLKSAVKDDAEAVSQLYRDTIGYLLHRLYDGTGIDVTDTIPLTAEEYVASNLGAHSLNYEGTETSKGVKQETGLSREDFAKTQLLAADGKGTTIDALVHSLWENLPSNLESLDTQDIRNALIGVLNSGFKASEARNFVENIRIAQAENILEEQKRAQENAAYAEQHKAEPEAELKAKSDEKAELKAKSEAKLDNESDNESNDLSNETDNEQKNDNINDNINVPEDATDEAPLGAQRDESDLPFSAKENGKQQTTAERAADVEKNKVDDMKVVDNIVGEKTRKTLEKLAKMMGANVQWQYSDKNANGWFDDKTNTIYLTLDSSITEGVQFIFGHEMTHEMRTKNPAAYDELKTLVKDMMGEDAFNKETDRITSLYNENNVFYNGGRTAYEEEVVADQLGSWIRDANYAHTLLLKMSHPLLARLHEIVNRFLMALHGTEFSDDMNLILRSIEQAYVKTANGQVTNSETGEDVSFSLRQKPEPKKKGVGYKVFVLKDGKLYPPMVANPDGAATPVGVWLDADAAPIAGESKTGRPQVKQGGKGTQGGSGKLAYRPGWHLGVVPYAIQFNRKDADGNKTLFPKNFVFAEVEYAADVDYQEEARQEGINPSGKYQHSLAGLKHLPTDGYYMYRTNPNPETDPWVITGAMKVNRILTRAEQAELVKNAGREPQQIQEGDIVTDDVVNSINQEIADAPKFSLKVYHGSGADFTEFDFDHMGEGAGSQAFGWGGYVTSSEEIGKSYVELTRKKPTYVYNGKEMSEDDLRSVLLDKVGRDNSNILDDFLYNLEKYGVSEAKSILRKGDYAYFKDLLKGTYGSIRSGYQNKVDAAELILAPRNIRVKKYKGNLYEVDIPDDNGNNYLDWDAPITDELIDKVAKALPSLRSYDIKDLKKDRTFDNFYKTISMRSVKDDAAFNDDKAASKLLASLGYTGIKYKAGRNFGGAEEGDTNYVIFKPEDMKITEHTKFSLRLKSAIEETETNPSDAQKESGNYKKGHIKFGGYDYTIENPKGSTRSGKDADGKEWKVTMHDTYGYIRGKFGKDGDHLDMFINDKADLDNWNGDVFVVDQVNPDGSFDEHKVMYGYDSMDDAKKAYLANYSKGWQGLGNITGVSKDEFDKWLDTSKRKLKPFADYAKVKFSLKDIKPVGVGAFGNIYNQFRGNAKAAIEFLKKVRGGEAVGALHHKDIGDIDLVWGNEGTGHSDGYGLSKLVKYHPEVLDNLQEILNDMRVVSSSKNRVNLESETHKAGVRLTWDGERKSWLLTAFKKETSASDKRTDTAATSLEGDTALSQTEGSAAKIDNSSETAKENGEKFSLKDEKTMFGMHNISVDKLRKAIKQGGFAAPSMGVVDSKNGIYSDYGEITLIPKAEKLAKRTGKNAGTFTADAWTPTYPQVERIMNKQGEKAFNTDMNVKLGDVDNGIYSNVRESWKGYLSSGDVRDGLYWHYLFDNGMNPETIYQTGKYDNDITNEVMRISDNGNKKDYTDKEVAELIQLMNKATGKDNDVDAQREKLKARIASAEKQGNHLLVALKKKRLEELEGVENFYIAADFVNDVVRNNRKNGKVDVHDTMGTAKKKVEDNKKLSDDFPSWLDKKTEEYGVEEMLYNGTTPSGKPKYIPNTIENAVKLMKKQGVAGGYTAFGSELGVFIAKNSPEVNTLAAMKNAKDKLIPFGDERHNQIKDKITKEFLELSDEIRVGSNNRYAFDDSGVSRMVELTDHKGNEKEYLKKAYNVEVSDEWMDRYNKLLDTIKKDYKVFYFETKFMRPYGLDEFEKAIVPSDTPSDVVDALKKAGIDVSSYERGNAEDRQKVTMDAINSSDNIRFSLAGERGAAAADKAEERTARMDNLSVARKMEEKKKDAKAIKMATGWERGADGKWRYEMPDAKIKDTMDVGGGHIVKRYEDDMLWNGGKLFDVIDAPELFKAYPQLKGVRIDTDAIMNDMPSHGEYDSKTNTITIHADELKYMNDILNHEIQHAIQGIEGFATGGSPTTIRGEVKKRFNEVTKQIKQLRAEGKEDEAKALIEKNRGLYDAYMKNDDFNSYKSLAGEVEARNVQERMNMTPEERRKTLAESTEDVARKDQIFLGVGDVSFSLRDMADGKESGAADMAEDLKSLNTPDEVDDAIKTAIEDMPSGWKMANKKMIHIAQALGENRKAEIAGEEPKFSLKDGTLIKAGTYFSGGGLVEEGLKGIIDPVVAVEYDEKISGVYRNNFGQHIVTADVRDVDPKELVKQIDGEVEYFHASPVCKNYSQAKSNHAEVELDKETAASTAEFINAIKPKVVTIENVKGYKDSEAMKTITDALDANGYTWDADVYNAADYGGYTNRERLIVRAVRDGKLPAKPEKMARKSGWYEAVADIIPTLTEKKNGVAPWMDIRLKADGIDWRNIDKPLYVMGSAYADGKVPHAFADELLPTLRTKSGDVIVMPDGKVYRAMGRVLARVSGVSDDYKMPFSENLSHIIIGNGIPTQLTEHVIAPLLQNTLRPTTPDEGNTKFSLRYDQFEHDLSQWKKDNNLPKDAQRPTIPQRNAGESAVDFLRRVDEYRKQMALWKTAPTYEQHLLSDDTALGEFNRELQRGSVLKRIAFQDSMLAIRKAQEAIMKEVGVDRLNMAEDAYTAENRSHGKGKNEFEEYNNEFLQPLRKAYHQMKKILGDSYDNVRIYMMAKHGLERDAQMAFKKSLEADYEDVAQRSAAYKAYKGDMNRIINDSDLEFGRVDFTTWRQRDNALRVKYSPSYMDYRYDKNGIAYDYSGLSALFDGSDFEETAHKLVKDIEDKYVTETHNLWDATNAATKKILRDGYKAGMMSKDTYQYVRDMYSHYIPLRGWDGTTADQVWDYIGGGKGAFNQTLKKAHGRTSIADDPIAYIENMAESGILLNNKNWVKQHLMLLAQNHPTSLLTLSKAWYVKSVDDNGNEEWIPATPQITSQMNSNQVKAAIDAFEKKMEQMAQAGDATQKRDGLNIAYPQTHSEEREHEVRVMKDGDEYVIYVNGDPQLAQAMNNTRAHRVREIQSGKLDRAAAWLGRKMAAAYTSLSPFFIPSNYFRDLTMTLASTAIREDGRYNYLLRKNLATSWNLGFMLRDYQNGKLRDKVNNGNATPKEQMFYDFMMNGGETGFVSSLDVEDLKKKFKNDLKDLDRWKTNPVKVGHTIMDGIEFLNRAIEDSNRFAVYMTSIQYGRSIDEAVNDAKDVTLNFNRKGTGEYGWQMIRNLYLFINPAVQSLQTLGALAKHHPFKFTAVTASWLASGVLVPIVNAALMSMLGGDDDKDKYWQFTKWDRRNNLIMWVPYTHEYVKIPLAQEFRAFYGIGDMIASKMMGGELAEESWSQYAEDLLGQVVDMLPLDPTGYDGNIAVSLMPNAIRPVFELAFNVDFTGKPLFKETEYNKYDPNFTKAYVGTPDWLVRASRMVNSIGNDYPDVQQNSIDAFGDPRYNLNNPAVVDHVLSSYLGGAYTMGSQVLGLLTKSLNDPKEIKVADIPLFSKFVSNPDDRPVTKKQGDEFWNMKENHDRAANTLSKLKKQAKVDGDYSMLERFYGSEEYKKYKQDDVKVKKYEEDKKKERAEDSGEEYRPHKLNAEDIYKAHATPKDDFEDLKLKQLYTKLNGFKTSYDLLVDTAPSQSDGYYNNNKAAIDAIDEISLDKQEISELKKGFLDDGKDAYNAEDMKQIRDLRKKILSVLEKANKVVVANQKAKAKK
jgi:site-specific DNA-cytosine methylase